MSSSDENKLSIGCFIILLLIFLVPVLIDLIKTLIPLAIIGGIGYCIFQIQQYDRRTGNVTELFEKTFNVNQSGQRHQDKNTINLNQNTKGVYGLPQPQEDLLQKLDTLTKKFEQLEHENKNLLGNRDKEIKKALSDYAEKIDRKNKENLMKDVFGETPKDDYAGSDQFELQKFHQKKRKIETELNFQKLALEVNQNLFEQEKKTHEFRYEAKEEREKMRVKIEERINYLEKEYMNFKGFVIEKFAYVDARITQEIAGVKELISNLRVELKQEIADFKVQVGREIVRLDKQMTQVFGKLHEYETKMEKFTLQIRQIKIDAERFQIRGERMLNQAQNLYQRHQSEMKVLAKDMDVSLQKIAVHKGDFANKVAGAKLMMDKISLDHYHSLKDIAHEKVGVNMLRSDHQNRVAASDAKLSKLVAEQRHIEEKIRINQNNFSKVSQLQHQLYVNQENLAHARGQNSIMRQEQALFKRLSK